MWWWWRWKNLNPFHLQIAKYAWNKEAEYQIYWRFSECTLCGFSSSTYGGTNVPISIRTAGVETLIGFSYSVTQQPDVVTWQHSSLKPVSSYCKSKYGRTTRRKAACRESDARRFASNDESRAAVDLNLVLKLLIQFGLNLQFLPRKNSFLETPAVEPSTGSGPKKKHWRKRSDRTWSGDVARLRDTRNAYKTFVGKHEWKRPLWQPRLI